MIAAPLSGSRRTTLCAGAGFAAVAAWELVQAVQLRIPAPNLFTLPFVASAIGWISAVVLLAACVLLARGVRGEAGLVASSPVAGGALVVFGAGQIAILLAQRLAPSDALDGSVPVIVTSTALTILPTAALVISAVIVARRRLLEPIARVGLLVTAACALVATAASSLPVEALVGIAVHASAGTYLSMLALGIGLVVHGRSSRIRRRLRVIHESW
jgi:hypothetical protein